jgi:hypothetical protein
MKISEAISGKGFTMVPRQSPTALTHKDKQAGWRNVEEADEKAVRILHQNYALMCAATTLFSMALTEIS